MVVNGSGNKTKATKGKKGGCMHACCIVAYLGAVGTSLLHSVYEILLSLFFLQHDSLLLCM